MHRGFQQIDVFGKTPYAGNPLAVVLDGSGMSTEEMQWLIGSGKAASTYVASQVTAIGRLGRIHVSQDTDGAIWIGGNTVTCIAGTVGL